MKINTVQKILLGAGMFNIGGVLIFSLFFTNPYPARYYPSVFSDFGMVLTIVWGMAYIASIPVYREAGILMFVFAAEKLAFAASWVIFLADKGIMLPGIFRESPVTGLMFGIYGFGDILFGCFFAWMGLRNSGITEFTIVNLFGLTGFENHKFLE